MKDGSSSSPALAAAVMGGSRLDLLPSDAGHRRRCRHVGARSLSRCRRRIQRQPLPKRLGLRPARSGSKRPLPRMILPSPIRWLPCPIAGKRTPQHRFRAVTHLMGDDAPSLTPRRRESASAARAPRSPARGTGPDIQFRRTQDPKRHSAFRRACATGASPKPHSTGWARARARACRTMPPSALGVCDEIILFICLKLTPREF